jgi:hypothetical protein
LVIGELKSASGESFSDSPLKHYQEGRLLQAAYEKLLKGGNQVIGLSTHLSTLNRIFGIWRFNSYLRVTYVGPDWLVVWDHRQSPPQRYDFKEVGNHENVCRLAAEQLQKMESNHQK